MLVLYVIPLVVICDDVVSSVVLYRICILSYRIVYNLSISPCDSDLELDGLPHYHRDYSIVVVLPNIRFIFGSSKFIFLKLLELLR